MKTKNTTSFCKEVAQATFYILKNKHICRNKL